MTQQPEISVVLSLAILQGVTSLLNEGMKAVGGPQSANIYLSWTQIAQEALNQHNAAVKAVGGQEANPLTKTDEGIKDGPPSNSSSPDQASGEPS